MRITGKTLDETDKKILEMIAKGKTCKEVAMSVYLKQESVKYRLRLMRREFNCQSTTHLIAHLTELELI